MTTPQFWILLTTNGLLGIYVAAHLWALLAAAQKTNEWLAMIYKRVAPHE